MQNMHTWMWWTKGKCIVKVIKLGHFPNTIIAQLPNNKETEIEAIDLVIPTNEQEDAYGKAKSID